MDQGLELTLAVPNKMPLPLSSACVENGKCRPPSGFQTVHSVSEYVNPAPPLIPTLLAALWASPHSCFFHSPIALQPASLSLALNILMTYKGSHLSFSANHRALELRGTTGCGDAGVAEPKLGPGIGCWGQSTRMVICRQ